MEESLLLTSKKKKTMPKIHRFECPYCKKSIYIYSNWNAHQRFFNKDNKKHLTTCPECETELEVQENVQRFFTCYKKEDIENFTL
jgi:RNase P subunit RPR2